MNKNNFLLELIARLNKALSRKQINADVKSLGDFYVPLIGRLSKQRTQDYAKKELDKTELEVNLTPKISKEDLQKAVDKASSNPVSVNMTLYDDGNVEKTTSHMSNLNRTAGNTESIFGRLKTALSNTFSAGHLAMTSYLMVLNQINQAGQRAKQAIQDLDGAVTDLSIAMNDSRERAMGYLGTLNKQGRDLGATTIEMSESADAWLRQGKNIQETETLIRDSIILSKVGKIESAEATDYLTSSLNGYKLAASDAIGVIDKLTAVDAESASEAGGLAMSMSRTASAANMAGVSMNKLIGWIATVKEVSRASDESVGNMFKTMLSRMNQVKAGKFVDEETGESLNDVETTLNKIGVAMRGVDGQFRSSEAVLDELGTRWNEFDSITQRAIATQLGGAYQYERVITLLSNYSKALEYAKVAENSAGSAMRKFEESYLNSIEAKQNTLQAAFESMVMNTDADEVYADILDATTALVDFVNETNAVRGAFLVLAVAGGVKSFLTIRTAVNEAYLGLNKFQNALNIVNKTRISTLDFDKLQLLVKGLSDSQMKMVLSSKSLTLAQKEQLLVASGLSAEEARLWLQTNGLTTAQTGLTAATTTLSNAFKGFFMTMAANPLMMIATAVSVGVIIWQTFSQKVQEAEQKLQESIQTFQEMTSEIESLEIKLSELNSQINGLDPITDAEDIKNLQAETAELEAQLAILKEKQRITGQEMDDTAQNSLNQTQTSRYSTVKVSARTGEGIAESVTKDQELLYAMDAYDQYKTKVDEANKALADMAQQGDYTRQQWKSQEQVMEIYTEKMEDARKHANELANAIEEQRAGLTGATEESQALIDRTSEAISSYDKWLTSLNGTNSALQTQAETEGAIAVAEPPVPTMKGFADVVENLSDLQSIYNDFYTDVQDGVDFTFEITDIEKLREAFGTTCNSFEEFERLATTQGTTQQELQKGFDTLATEYVFGTDALKGLNAKNREQILTQLELQGIMGADKIITGEFAQAYNDAAIAGIDFSNATYEEINALILEGQYSDDTQKKLYAYAIQKQLANENSLSTVADIEALRALCENLGIAADQLMWFSKLKSMQAMADRQIENTGSVNEGTAKTIEIYKNKVKELSTQISSTAIGYTNMDQSAGNAAKSVDKSSSSAKKATDTTKKLTEELEKQLDIYKEQKSELESFQSAINAFYDNRLDKLKDEKEAVQDNIDAWGKLGESIQWLLDGESDKYSDLIADLQAGNEILQKDLDNLDGILSVIDRVYSEEIELLQQKKDAIDEANDAREREKALTEAQIALETARNKKSVLLYEKGKGFVRTTSAEDERKAQSNLTDIKAGYNNQTAKDAIQEEIDKLTELKDAYADIPSAREQYLAEQDAIDRFGTDYKDIILGSGMDSVDNLKGEYTGIQIDQESNNDQIEIYENLKKQIEETMEFWESAADKFVESEHRKRLAAFAGDQYMSEILSGSLDKWNEYVDGYSKAQAQLSNVEARIESIEKLKSAWGDAFDYYGQRENEALLTKFIGSNYEQELLNNSSVWHQKYITEYSMVMEQIETLENQIKETSNQTAAEVTESAGQASNALKETGNQITSVRNTASNTESIGKYLWSPDDDTALSDAKGRLADIQNMLQYGYSPVLMEAERLLLNFIGSYSGLEESRQKSDELTQSLGALAESENVYITSFAGTVDGVNARLADASMWESEVISKTENVNTAVSGLNDSLSSIGTAENKVDQTVEEQVTDINTTINTALESISKLNEALSVLNTSQNTIEETTDQAIADTSSIVSESSEKIQAIKDSAVSLQVAVATVQVSLATLIGAMSTLDGMQFNNVVGRIGSFTSEDASSLFGAVNSVIMSINGEEGLLAQLGVLDTTTLDMITTEFGGDTDSLICAIRDVTGALYVEGDDNCLTARINKLAETVQNVKTVEDAFALLEIQVDGCFQKLCQVEDKLKALDGKESHSYHYIHTVEVDGYATGTAWTGSISNTKPVLSGDAYASGSWGLKEDKKGALIAENSPEILVRDGQYQVFYTPKLIDLKKNDIIFNGEQTRAILQGGRTSKINRLAESGINAATKLFGGHAFSDGTVDPVLLKRLMDMEPNYQYKAFDSVSNGYKGVNNVTNRNNESKKVSISIGDIHVTGVQDPNGLSREIIKKLPNRLLQDLSKR